MKTRQNKDHFIMRSIYIPSSKNRFHQPTSLKNRIPFRLQQFLLCLRNSGSFCQMANNPPNPPSYFAATSWPSLEIVTGDSPAIQEIHATVVDFLSADEKRDFKNMTENKIAVIGLYYETIMDYLPAIDSTTYRRFGYSKIHDMDEPALLGLYQGLIRILDCKIQDFLEAYENGKLFSLIKSTFSQLPIESRGDYYSWFLEKKELFDSLKPQSVHHVVGEESMINACRVCRKATTTLCGRCKKVWYCTKEHQKADWRDHKKMCHNEQ